MLTNRLCTARYRRPITAAALLLLVTVSGTTAQAAAGSQAHGHAQPRNMLTCAHRTLPIGTLLRVTNLGNKRAIMVRVNDRGPLEPGLILDLSYAAARSLGFNGKGMARVRLEKVEGAETAQLNWPELGLPQPAAASR